MTLKSIYLVLRNLLAWARLSRQDAAAKNVEILMLRHQLAIAQRRAPPRELHRKLSWAIGHGWRCWGTYCPTTTLRVLG